MHFTTDKQTIDDLNIFGKSGGDSIYHIFNKTYTHGGGRLLEEMFRHPLSTDEAINERIAILGYFYGAGGEFPLAGNRFEEAERYLSNTDVRSRLSNQGFSMADYKTIQQSVLAVIEILRGLRGYLKGIRESVSGNPYGREVEAVLGLLGGRELELVFAGDIKEKPSSGKVVECDSIFRFLHRGLLEKILGYVYRLDVYISVARVARERGFVFPRALRSGELRLHLKGVYHPLLAGAVANTLDMDPARHILFLTGANMAGKSTFMKSLGIAMYLAHIGFPVAASEMEFSVCDGIYTTINLSDNLGMGASHFYAEVLRVKKIAGELGAGRRLFVIFDELFRGTNVKDAYEATVAIMEAFARKESSMFVISTHIMEAGAVLRHRCENMQFRYLPTTMRDGVPVYTYKLVDGITEDRHGMVIINNEGIVELINQRKEAKAVAGGAEFSADKQTVEDLQLLGKFKQQSVYSLFNTMQTQGGEKLLEGMFRHPLTDHVLINKRSELLYFFQSQGLSFPATKSQIEAMEDWLLGGAGASFMRVATHIMLKKIRQSLLHDADLLQLQAGLTVTLEVLSAFREFFEDLGRRDVRGVYRQETTEALGILGNSTMQSILASSNRELSLMQIIRMDYTIRHGYLKEMERLLAIIYQVDVYTGIGMVAAERGFVYAEAMPAEKMSIEIEGLYHPALKHAVRNSLRLSADRNVLFLTGANMAGKSTFMKSFGIAVYLAHMGFPVAAEKMVFSVKDGLFSSINVSDDLNMGYSHFYAEVLRTKAVAEAVHGSQDLFVIFDELFKGTNVKDAYDATLAVTRAFAANRNSFFIVSTHIIEVGEALGQECENIGFVYLPTVMEGNRPRYTYRLEEGITQDRQGMLIIENEKILEMI